MDGEAAAAVLQVLVQNLIDHSKKEISLIGGLDKEAAKLTGSLDTIQKFLNDAEKSSIPGEAVKGWLEKLENVAFDADNVLDELNYHLLSKEIKIVQSTKLKVLSCFSSFNHVARRRKMGLKIKEINENLESINKEATELGLVERLANVNVLDAAAFETDSFSVDPIFIGRDDVVSVIVEMLTSSGITTDDERVISIIPIVGMGGLGKTTLTRKIFNHKQVVTQFGSRIWVHVSQNFDPTIMFKKILKELTCDQIDVESRQDILRKLQQALKDKTYLLVLDDNWNQDQSDWEDFMNSLLGVTCMKGNVIVVTTRNMEVASIVKPLHIHELKGLSEEDCWSIIKGKNFGKEYVPSEFETIGRKIARKCQGLPLAANVVGGVLSNNSIETWISIEQKWLSHDEAHNIRKILRLSFDNLSPPLLKKCFAYCSIYPKGCKIDKQSLIEYWMAEGFLEGDGSDDMESVGDKFINILLHNSLLQVAKRDVYGDVQVCEMHDLVHDLACFVLCSSGNSSRVRYMVHEDKSSPIPMKVAKHLRTLFLKGEISSTNFSDFECLHVLTLDCYGVEELPSLIRKLIHLRNLDISQTGFNKLPEWIGELHHLQTLRVGRYLRKLPSTLKYLINLRHLYLDSLVELPAEIGRLTFLQTLLYFKVGDTNGCKIEELGSLNELKGKLTILNLEKVGDKEEAKKANLFQKSKLQELCLRWEWNTRKEDETNDENVLEGLQPHPNLKKLEIYGYKGKRFLLWTLKMAVWNVARDSWIGLNKLINITLFQCSECEEIPMLGHLPNLKYLELKELSNVKCINSSFYGLVNKETCIVFPFLERLKLLKMPKLAEWAQVEFGGASEVKVFPRLEYLEICECKQLMSVPTHLWSCLQHLKIRTSNSMPLVNIFQIKLALLTELYLEELDELECLPDWLFYNNPNLLELEIRNCPNLRELPDGICTLSSLKELIIHDCPNLERIASNPIGEEQSAESFTSLRRIEINKCHVLVCLPCEMVGSTLETLSLAELSSLKNLPNLIDCLPKSPRLRELRIEGVPKFMATTCVEIWPFRSLRRLIIDASMGGTGSSSMEETVDGILQGCCHSLHSLTLIGIESWECLPESIQHLTASTIKLENFGMEDLPEWFGNLSSLEWLYLVSCKKLRRLPSMDAMRCLTRLIMLTVEGCPELVIQSDEGDSEWPKISHIPYITIDCSNPNAGHSWSD